MAKVHLRGLYVPMSLVKELGIEKAFLYCYMVNKLPSVRKKFILTVEELESDTGLNDYLQRTLLKKLETLGYLKLSYTTKGMEQESDDWNPTKRCIEVLKLPTDAAASLIAM